jgi:hypothetical protein
MPNSETKGMRQLVNKPKHPDYEPDLNFKKAKQEAREQKSLF